MNLFKYIHRFIVNRNFHVKIRHISEMRFIQFYTKDSTIKHLGVIDKDGKNFQDISEHVLSNDMIDFIENFSFEETLRKTIEKLPQVPITDEIRILPPVSNPKKIIAIGLNYSDHCAEQKKEIPKEPMFFSKFSNCIIGPTDNILYPSVTNALDFEVELAVIIGKKAVNVSKNDALNYVFGYTVAQDISARDWQKQKNGGQFLLGKSMDTFLPLGPSIVHKSLIPDPYVLTLTCKVNGVVKQQEKSDKMIFKIEDIIAYLSRMITLEPGDILLTGTPGGVGMHRDPPEYLQPGDILESEIDQIGKITNPVVAKP